MKITILAISKKHDPKLRASIEDYCARLAHYTSLEWKLIEARVTPSQSNNEIRDTESRELMKHIATGDTIFLLDETGTQLSSPELASKLQTYMNQGTKRILLVIGGAFGVTEELRNRANFIWSLSKLVFPHQLVRLILVEQLYRAHTILANEKYHHI
ncbi:23S rRNA (pseudouridine(1915)-N(3))-methyltransferase RlmH [Candidatus Saccharibacteria bacterium]|nr:23S rRNA (pseudouridine(1915)-N(3))-methyltransferase RlmH [Candidatus Saccharibacteria bacterium]